ncbi:MAG: class I SAM-dependent methyltransferase [Euryarchaeota archaeon]|nr:class I SAM-dependent methyltransferase [Euryarchaeota archaeon]
MARHGEGSQQEHWEATYTSAADFFGKEPSELVISVLGVMRDSGAKDVLELGCGQGRDTLYLCRNGFTVTALDYSETGICQMGERAKEWGADVTLKVHDAREPLPFPDNTFDVIYSHMFFTMELTEAEVASILKECWRVLRPGGLNIYSVRNDHDPHYGKFEKVGEDMWRNPRGFIVHFFNEEKIKRLSKDYELLWIKEFEDGAPPFLKRLYEVVLRKPQA